MMLLCICKQAAIKTISDALYTVTISLSLALSHSLTQAAIKTISDALYTVTISLTLSLSLTLTHKPRLR